MVSLLTLSFVLKSSSLMLYILSGSFLKLSFYSVLSNILPSLSTKAGLLSISSLNCYISLLDFVDNSFGISFYKSLIYSFIFLSMVDLSILSLALSFAVCEFYIKFAVSFLCYILYCFISSNG